MNDARKSWLAAAMSMVLPGFGQLYNGEPNKAIWLFLCFALLSVPGVALVALHLPDAWVLPALVAGLVATLGLWLYGIADAWRTAAKRPDYRRQPWQTTGLYLLVLLMCDFLALPLLIAHVSSREVASFHVASNSMEPAVVHGDFIFADMRYNCPNWGCKGAIRRGDIAVFVYPNDRTVYYIKRIIALPGDQVSISGQRVSVNGKPLSAAWGSEESADGHAWVATWGETGNADKADLLVPPGQVFVLGDNRAASADSRKFGTVPMQDVVGRACQVWFSRAAGVTNWQRLGKVLE
jgi:signal peptidase I